MPLSSANEVFVRSSTRILHLSKVPRQLALKRCARYRAPLFFEEGRYYGFPIFGIPGFKIGRYHHLEEVVDPDHVEREVTLEDEEILRVAVAKYFPKANGTLMTLKTCMFTNTPDEHFIIDLLPDHPQVSVAAGFSGHGFKFASVVGEILGDLALNGKTTHDIELLRIDRF